jgi:hypothetical protein
MGLTGTSCPASMTRSPTAVCLSHDQTVWSERCLLVTASVKGVATTTAAQPAAALCSSALALAQHQLVRLCCFLQTTNHPHIHYLSPASMPNPPLPVSCHIPAGCAHLPARGHHPAFCFLQAIIYITLSHPQPPLTLFFLPLFYPTGRAHLPARGHHPALQPAPRGRA